MSEEKSQKRRLVQETAERLRDIILQREAGAQIGSLTEVAQLLGVGIVTVQQAARILEHEGLLKVKRGPRGGYYGARPDDAALERAFSVYLRVHGVAQRDTSEMMAMIDSELLTAAAHCEDEALRDELRQLDAHIDRCETPEDRFRFEQDLRNVLFRIVSRPLIELLARVTTQLYKTQPRPVLFAGPDGVELWRSSRHRTLQAILQRDAELARFEAERFRAAYMARLRDVENGAHPAR